MANPPWPLVEAGTGTGKTVSLIACGYPYRPSIWATAWCISTATVSRCRSRLRCSRSAGYPAQLPAWNFQFSLAKGAGGYVCCQARTSMLKRKPVPGQPSAGFCR